MVALPFLDVAAATLANFDLAALPDEVGSGRDTPIVTTHTRRRSPDLLPQIDEPSSDGDGVRVRIHGRKVKLYVPFGPS